MNIVPSVADRLSDRVRNQSEDSLNLRMPERSNLKILVARRLWRLMSTEMLVVAAQAGVLDGLSPFTRPGEVFDE